MSYQLVTHQTFNDENNAGKKICFLCQKTTDESLINPVGKRGKLILNDIYPFMFYMLLFLMFFQEHT